MTKLAKFIQWGLLALLALMPFHAFLSVALGHAVGHQTLIQSWKEVLLALLALAAVGLVIREPERLERLRRPWIYAAAALVLLGIIITAAARPGLLTAVFGLKTDFEFILAGVLAAIIASPEFINRAERIVIWGAAIVTGFDLLQIFVLPADFLTRFGYGPATILPFQHIAAGTAFLRFPATLGGPNQLGTYLILPLALNLILFGRRRNYWYLALFGASLISLIWTFSRSAWIGAAAAIVLTILAVLPVKARRPAAIVSTVVLAAVLLALPFLLQKGGALQYFVLHSSVSNHDQLAGSDYQHALSLQNGVRSLLERPLGHGLGTAGPSTFHVGSANIIENYYLQIGYEIGLLAVLLFVLISGALIWNLLKFSSHQPLAVAAAAAFIGISIVALVLPAWVDSSTSIIAWICAGAAARYRGV